MNRSGFEFLILADVVPVIPWAEREQLRIAPLVRDLHRLGPRPLYEFLPALDCPGRTRANEGS